VDGLGETSSTGSEGRRQRGQIGITRLLYKVFLLLGRKGRNIVMQLSYCDGFRLKLSSNFTEHR
jgi:hypothetical protein